MVNNVSGKNMNWFFDRWFFSNGYIDLGIEDNKNTKAGYEPTVKNISGFSVPFDVVVVYADNSTEQIHQSPAVCSANHKSAVINLN